jgi:hypothetical protein
MTAHHSSVQQAGCQGIGRRTRLARVEALLEMGMFHHLKCTRLYYRPGVNSTAAESSETRLQSQSPKSAAVSKTEQRNRSPFTIIS